MEDFVLVEDTSPGIRRITLNRPDARNAFTYAMYQRLLEVFEELGTDLHIRVAILTGSGTAFSTGHDMREARSNALAPGHLGKLYANKLTMAKLARIPLAIRSAPQPVIAAVNGTAAGIGYALALAADISIAGASAKFVNSVHNAGTGHELGMSYLLSRQVGSQQTAELLYTARPVHADEAERIGLVLRTVEDAALMEQAEELASSIAQNVPMGIWMTKQSLWLNQNAPSLEAAIELESRAVQVAQATQDAVEKRKSFVEKREPDFKLE